MRHLTDGSKVVEPAEIAGPGQRFKKEVAQDRSRPTWNDFAEEYRIRDVSELPSLFSSTMGAFYGDKPYIRSERCGHYRKRYTGGCWFCRDCGAELK